MEKQTFLLRSITSTGTKKQLKRRTVAGTIAAIFTDHWVADGFIITNDGKEKVEKQSRKDLLALGVQKIQVPGVKKGMAISIA